MSNFLLPEKLKTPAFYLLPKTHKPNNPVTSSINSVDYHTSRISEFADHYLQLALPNLKSYVKDTT